MKTRIKIINNDNKLILFNILTFEILVLSGNEIIRDLIENHDIEEIKGIRRTLSLRE